MSLAEIGDGYEFLTITAYEALNAAGRRARGRTKAAREGTTLSSSSHLADRPRFRQGGKGVLFIPGTPRNGRLRFVRGMPLREANQQVGVPSQPYTRSAAGYSGGWSTVSSTAGASAHKFSTAG